MGHSKDVIPIFNNKQNPFHISHLFDYMENWIILDADKGIIQRFTVWPNGNSRSMNTHEIIVLLHIVTKWIIGAIL